MSRAKKPQTQQELLLAVAKRDVAKTLWRAACDLVDRTEREFNTAPTFESQAKKEAARLARGALWTDYDAAEKALQP